MNGITGATARIAEIQSRIVAMQTQLAGAPKTAAPGSTAPANGASFAAQLADAVKAGESLNGNPATGIDKKYKLNSKGIPTELAAYGNGKIPANALVKVGDTNHRLWAPAAESLNRMIEAAKKDGVKIGITDSYRSYGEQVDLARRKGLYSQGGLAAKPGTSEHGWGMATDLDLNNKAQAWMRAHGKEYGFVENVPREPWHWAYKPPT
ncbi:MAG TPA: M15 family metallopeptidase [Actinoplanes sp.]|nr:M15 family metallopeptidase [Actinoplanes sp.]